MNVHLTPEQERIVRDEVKSGHFQTAEEVIDEALHALHEKEHSSPDALTADGGIEAIQELLRLIEKNCVRLEGVSVKTLIHEGHRL